MIAVYVCTYNNNNSVRNLMCDGETMFCGTRSIFVIFLATLCCTCGDNAIRRANEKRRDDGADGYQMCLESFDIHRDKIIKTQDSRDMGAKYLSVLDVDSRVDCLKYCCETEQCDVFIFEEKVTRMKETNV